MKKSELRQQIRSMIKEDLAMDLPTATIPADVKAKLLLAIERIKAAKLTYNQKLQIVGQVFDSLGIDKAELNKMSTKLRTAMPPTAAPVTEAKKVKKAVVKETKKPKAVVKETKKPKAVVKETKKPKAVKEAKKPVKEVAKKTVKEVAKKRK